MSEDIREPLVSNDSVQDPLPQAQDSHNVDFLGKEYPDSEIREIKRSHNEIIPEIEIKLESSDDDEDKSEVSSWPLPFQRKRKIANSLEVGTGPQKDHREHEGSLSIAQNTTPLVARPTRKRKSTSEVWQFFYRDPTIISRAVCTLCRMSVSRGKLGGRFGTTALKRHLESKHPQQWAQRRSMRLQKPDVEEEEEETYVDEDEIDESYQNPFNMAIMQFLYQKPMPNEKNAVECTVAHGSPKTYEIIDSSDDEEDKERGDNIMVEFGEAMTSKKTTEQGSGLVSSFHIDARNASHPFPGLGKTQPVVSQTFSSTDYSPVPLGARRRKSTSAVWQFFYLDRTNICRAICNLCQASVGRGKLGGHLGTSALMRHLEGKHPLEWSRGKMNKPNTAVVLEADEDEDEDIDEPIGYPQRAFSKFRLTGFPMYPSEMPEHLNPTLHTVPIEYDNDNEDPEMQSSLQISFKENILDPTGIILKANGKYPSDHPKAQSWNRSITELMCEMALPYSFVTSKAFRRFMAQADPHYSVPTRSFFSGKAVPQIYESVCERIVSDLKMSGCPQVHITAHVRSNDLSMNYLALTAHWAVLKPDADQSAERKHALICIKRFTKEYTEGSIQQELIQQVSLWLLPNALCPGLFVSSADVNLMHAIKGANYTYVPCFTHSLNLLVTDFLQNNRYIAGMLTMARKVCSYFIHSSRARRILSELQFQNNLPKHSLKLETIPHWTSTFYMLQRLLEQQRAVQEYLVMHKVEAVDIHLSSSHWNLMTSLVDLLQPFEMAIREVNASQSSLSQVLPELRYLHIFLKQIRGHFESKGDANGVVLADSFALKLSTDYGVNEIFQKEEFILATLLDPRFKGRIEAILPVDSDIDHWKQVLVKKVKEVMSSSSSSVYLPSQVSHSTSQVREDSQSHVLSSKQFDRETSMMTMAPQWRKNVTASPLIHKEKSLIEHLESVGLLASKSTGASLSTESHSACIMVERYLQDNKTIGAKDDPLIYWQKRTWLWPALTKLAVMYLTCPPSSVFAELVFKSPRVFMDAQRRPDITEGLEHIIFLKVNLQNFPSYNLPSLIFSEDNEIEQSDSDDGF
ncbi:zinc finger BED domain-containing protein 6-like [Bufo bufo]|uniref:zinc finger BED domain-containing protein 6-like n=1 Tax=Bufo bufo TaxID=8384 RepID=UPI001ABE277A|nr:zinc finger BED domain-containing protein 6-like [Bufo bufo]